MSTGRVATAAALLAAALVAGCTGGDGSGRTSGPTGSAGSGTASPGAVAVRWWTNHAARAGSRIDPSNPTAVASRLHPSESDYCTMLRQTVSAGRSILPDVTAKDPALLTTTRAFVAELQHVAPNTVAAAWHTLGPAVVALVSSGGALDALKGTDSGALQHAGDVIAAQAKRACHLDLTLAAH